MTDEVELHKIVNKLQDRADLAKHSTCPDLGSLYESWIEQIICGHATLKQARQMLKASK